MNRKMDRLSFPVQRVTAVNRSASYSKPVQRTSPAVTRPTLSSMQKYGGTAASKELKDVLEKKIEDLSRQLADERQSARQNKLAVTRLQRELARSRSQDRHQGKEQLSRELENEKMHRVEAERRLLEMTRESESCHSRLECLQGEFKKMEGMVHEMIQYKSKIDQLKQEKSSLSTTYEINIEKFKNHITELERENMVLLNEVKKLESQMNQKTDGRDRYKLLLERLRMVEGENSSLVLENEQQRGQYEKCLDEIANQVVQALLAQKMLREECLKLQDKVQDLEHQKRQLCSFFQQRLKMIAEGNAQDVGVFIEGSMESLHSMFSEQTSENMAGVPQMSSPPLWLKERLPGDRQSIVSFTGSLVVSSPDMDLDLSPEHGEFRCRTEIETEFPATPSSPKSKHVSFVERKNETKRSSSTSSLVMPKCGPSRQRTRSTSSLSRARGLSLISPQTVSKSHDSGIQNTATNEHLGFNQGMAVSVNQKSSKKTVTNPDCITNITVPLNQSHPSISNRSSQGHMSQSSSKIPTLPGGKSKEDIQVRRNSLKAEYSIRMGCQSPVIRNSPSPNPNSKPPYSKTQGSRSSSVSSGGQSHSRSPSVSSGRSQSAGSKIPTVTKASMQSSSKPTSKENVSTQNKFKTGSDKQNTSAPSKLIPPKSPNLRYSGIRTTLKTETKAVSKSEISKSNKTSTTTLSLSSTSSNLKTVYSISPVISSKVSDAKKQETKKPAIPVRGTKPVNHRSESHFPIMGLTTLSQTSPKNDDVSNVYANVTQVPSNFSTTPGRSDLVYQNNEQSECNTLTRGQYFYDYSDEDSDFKDADLKRPVSTDFSAASTISLDELLDRTLENADAQVDSDFSSVCFLYPPSQKLTESKSGPNANNASFVSNTENENTQIVSSTTQNRKSEKSKSNQNNANISNKEIEAKNRLMGKPDIVQDTEECEQRMLQHSLTLSQIPGSSMPGYRAKRPKSLILGAKEKKFLYCEYGSSSSSDTSDDELRCRFSYAKNVKEQEIQSMVAKSVKSGEAKVIESPRSSSANKELHATKSKATVSESNATKSSQLPKPGGGLKKPSRIPPPVATKPSHKVSTNPKTDTQVPRPKSVEICVNTAELSSVNSKLFHDAGCSDFSKSESEMCLIKSFEKNENSSMTINTTFDEVKVERSGSKDDGYSTMSSDIQPENLEKYSDAFESSTNSNEARNSNLSLSSQNSYSSEDRLSGHGSIGRVKAMKMKFEIEGHKSPESSPTKSPPVSPKRSLLKSPKSVSERFTSKCSIETTTVDSTGSVPQVSKIPKPKGIQTSQNKQKSAIPLPKGSSASAKKDHVVTKVEINIQNRVDKNTQEIPQQATVQTRAVETTTFHLKNSPVITVPSNKVNTQQFLIGNNSDLTNKQQHTMTKTVVEEFNRLTYFPPAFDKMEVLVEGYDSNSSLSDRGSDLTSLHISEDNILSDIPEEKDGYESSVGILSENTSFSSLPAINLKKPQQTTHNSHTHHVSAKAQFSTTLKRFWSSQHGLVRAISNSDYEKQKRTRQMADYDELYAGCLNIETLLERSSSESDMFTRGDKPEVCLLPKLFRSKSAEHLVIDEMAVEEKLQAMLKQDMLHQIAKNVESADKDGETFTNFVELLVQRGHVLESPSPLKEAQITTVETPTALNNMTVSNFSSVGQNVSPASFVSEERPEAEMPPLWEDQKKFNSQFYSLCNTGSSRSISEKSEIPNNDSAANKDKPTENGVKTHTCQNGDMCCKTCEEEKNLNEFDSISRQIESLSKTVNQLHRSLSSLNSENTDSGSESNEGDIGLSSAIGNKVIDGYHWVEDEFFLSPYGGEIILGSSPFSKTGASCDWINNYSETVDQIEDVGGDEALLEDPDIDINLDFDKNSFKNKRNSMQNSIIADSLDEQGNFDSQHFISRRLQQEEERRRAQVDNGSAVDMTMPQLLKLESTMNQVLKSRPLLKEDLRITPEKDTDDTERPVDKKHTEMFERMMVYGGSQDSLDDNIGVDSMMCHRLLGGKGQNILNKGQQSMRPQLEFSSSQFVRYDDPEIQAMAEFDFLNEMSSSQTSDQLNDHKVLHDSDQHLRREGRKYSSSGYQHQMNQSTTSTESRTSPVKRQRRKLRQRTRKGPNVGIYNQGLPKTRKFSSTSADESNDEDTSLSDSCCDSSAEDTGNTEKQHSRPNTKMTYL